MFFHLWRSLAAIALLLIPLAASAQPAPTTAPSPSPSPTVTPLRTIGTVSVASKTKHAIATLPVQADYISPQEIHASTGRTIETVLGSIPGYTSVTTDSWYYGQHGNSDDLRGLGPGSVLVLYDGVPVNDPLGSWVSWSKVPRLLVDSVEVAHGGASALYGSQAIGGVIAIESVHPQKDAIAFDEFTGNLGTTGSQLAINKSLGDGWGASAYVAREDSKGYIRDTPGNYFPADPYFGYIGQYLRAQVVHGTPSTGMFEVAAMTDNDHRDGDISGPTWYYGRNTLARYVKDSGKTTYNVTTYLANDSYTFDRFSGAAGTTPNGFGWMSLDTTGLLATVTRELGNDFSLTVGTDGRNVAGWRNEPRPATQSLYVTGNQQFAGAFIQGDLTAGRSELIATGRYDVYSQRQATETGYGTQNTFTNFPSTSQDHLSPRIAYRYQLSPHWLLRTSFGDAFKAPDWGSLYSSYPGNGTVVGNPDLKAMSVDQEEGGVEWDPDGFTRTYLTFYRGTENNRIVMLTKISQAAYQLITGFPENVNSTVTTSVNVPQAQVGGYELSVQRFVGEHLALRASYANSTSTVTQDLSPALQSILQCGSAKPNSNCVLKSSVGNVIPDTPRTSGDLSLRYFDAFNTFEAEVRSMGRAYADEQNTQPIDGMVLFNFGFSHRISRLASVYAEFENLFNRRWMVDSTSYGPPRTVVFGVRRQF